MDPHHRKEVLSLLLKNGKSFTDIAYVNFTTKTERQQMHSGLTFTEAIDTYSLGIDEFLSLDPALVKQKRSEFVGDRFVVDFRTCEDEFYSGWVLTAIPEREKAYVTGAAQQDSRHAARQDPRLAA